MATDLPKTDSTLSLPENSEVVTPGERAREDKRLLRRYHGAGEVAARDELVERFLPLARQLARRYQRGNEPLDDLVQVASIGLVKAVDRFDPERGTAFSSYAVPTILGELKRYFRDSGWAVHVPRGMQDPELVLEALEAAIAYDAVSLDTPRTSEEEDGDTYADTMGVIDERFELVEYKSAIGPTMRALPARDRLVLKLRFEEDLTQLEIAERIGVSQMHVSRLIRRALKRLRTVADAQ
jgi:RNA polymerase sigma-B factor